jgi:hypothetical protein
MATAHLQDVLLDGPEFNPIPCTGRRSSRASITAPSWSSSSTSRSAASVTRRSISLRCFPISRAAERSIIALDQPAAHWSQKTGFWLNVRVFLPSPPAMRRRDAQRPLHGRVDAMRNPADYAEEPRVTGVIGSSPARSAGEGNGDGETGRWLQRQISFAPEASSKTRVRLNFRALRV